VEGFDALVPGVPLLESLEKEASSPFASQRLNPAEICGSAWDKSFWVKFFHHRVFVGIRILDAGFNPSRSIL